MKFKILSYLENFAGIVIVVHSPTIPSFIIHWRLFFGMFFSLPSLACCTCSRAYEQRVRDVEHSTFTPIVLSATGGMAKQSTTFYKRLASRLAEKWEQTYCSTLYWLRVRLSFSLLRSAIQCIRGARSSRGHAVKSSPIDLIRSEASLYTQENWNIKKTHHIFFIITWIVSSPPPKNGGKTCSSSLRSPLLLVCKPCAYNGKPCNVHIYLK